jgi:hypothetical protein
MVVVLLAAVACRGCPMRTKISLTKEHLQELNACLDLGLCSSFVYNMRSQISANFSPCWICAKRSIYKAWVSMFSFLFPFPSLSVYHFSLKFFVQPCCIALLINCSRPSLLFTDVYTFFSLQDMFSLINDWFLGSISCRRNDVVEFDLLIFNPELLLPFVNCMIPILNNWLPCRLVQLEPFCVLYLHLYVSTAVAFVAESLLQHSFRGVTSFKIINGAR